MSIGKLLPLVALLLCIGIVAVDAKGLFDFAKHSIPEGIFEADLSALPLVRRLGALKAHHERLESTQGLSGVIANFQERAFAFLFPFGPRWNSVLATFYISSFPNFILALVPADLNPANLNTMIAFATGGLLGDVCMHLIPHAFLGGEGGGAEAGHGHGGVRLLVVEEKRAVLVGLAIFGGFFAFFALDKTMRVLNAGAADEDQGHGHHHHGHSHSTGTSTAIDPSKNTQGGLSQRKGKGEKEKEGQVVSQEKAAAPSTSLKLSAYLNLFGDFTHNITDGLAMAASFYASPQLGAISTFATFCHEIPHEIADYSILIKSGFTKRQAMGSQFLTAVGAFVGTFLGIVIAETAASAAGVNGGSDINKGLDLAAIVTGKGKGFLGTSVTGADLVIPATAGGFLYIASVSVIPELLAESKSVKQTLKEFGFMIFGVLVMGFLAWNE